MFEVYLVRILIWDEFGLDVPGAGELELKQVVPRKPASADTQLFKSKLKISVVWHSLRNLIGDTIDACDDSVGDEARSVGVKALCHASATTPDYEPPNGPSYY